MLLISMYAYKNDVTDKGTQRGHNSVYIVHVRVHVLSNVTDHIKESESWHSETVFPCRSVIMSGQGVTAGNRYYPFIETRYIHVYTIFKYCGKLDVNTIIYIYAIHFVHSICHVHI